MATPMTKRDPIMVLEENPLAVGAAVRQCANKPSMVVGPTVRRPIARCQQCRTFT